MHYLNLKEKLTLLENVIMERERHYGKENVITERGVLPSLPMPGSLDKRKSMFHRKKA